MKRALMLAVFAAFASGAAIAQPEVLRANGCLGCHDVAQSKIGPPLRDVAAKYKGDKSRAGEVVAKMKEGKGHPKIVRPDAELKAAVEAALSVK